MGLFDFCGIRGNKEVHFLILLITIIQQESVTAIGCMKEGGREGIRTRTWEGVLTRAKVSLRAHHGSSVRYCNLANEKGKFSFMVEAANMSRYSGLQNKIASPGKKLLEMASPEKLKEVFSVVFNPSSWTLF